MIPRTLAPVAVGLVLITGLSACGSDETPNTATASTPAEASTSAPAPHASASGQAGHGAAAAVASGTVQAQDQTSDGTSLTVAQVDLEGIDQGFIGVHMDLEGKPGPVVGVAQIQKGSTGDLVVRFDKPVTSGAFWPMLHVDDFAVGTYEFTKVAGADLPVKTGDQIVMKKIALTVS